MTATNTAPETPDRPQPNPAAYTPKKGKATPKRRDVERAHGVNLPPVQAPETAAEARRRKKELKNSMTKEEYKAYKAKQKEERIAESKQARARMDAGDENYLLERDRGPVKRYVRDWVDSRRFFSELVMPVALALLIILLIGQFFPTVGTTLSLAAFIIIIFFFIDGFVISRKVNRDVRAVFPEHAAETGFSLGFYAWSRASQIRRLRTPRPQVSVGDSV
ncbi:MAG: DUF3043 domain-containing protein [Corynebacterium sp.]|nr:DUF3043 domain-containing protein [Corynebacterium sp.]